MIDSHCHLEHMEDPQGVARQAMGMMSGVVTSAPDPRHFGAVMNLRDKFPGFVHIAIGFHPEHLDEYASEQIEGHIQRIRDNSSKIVSIGEVGLDYSWIKEEAKREKTKIIFKKFIDLSLELKKPLTIHARNGSEGEDAISETIEILKSKQAGNVMMHCFSGSDRNLEDCLKQGWMISFATLIVRSRKHQRFAAQVPMDQMLLETDAPWLDPDSRELANRPWKIARSAEVIAEIKGISKQEVLDRTEKNARRFFGIS